MSLHDYMPPYHYDTEDFGQLRIAYDALESDIALCQSILDTATTPGKWNTEILNEMIAMTGYADYIQYLTTDAARREFLFYYLTNMRLMNEAAFAKHVELAFGFKDFTWVAIPDEPGTWPWGRNRTDFIPAVDPFYPIHPRYTITINNSRDVYIQVECNDYACEHYTPDGVNTHTLAYDRLIGHISETFPIGFRLKLDVNLLPVGSDNEIYIGAVSTNTDEQYSETGDSANIYPQTYVYRLLDEYDPPSKNDVLNADWTGTTDPLRFYVEGLWYDADDLEAHGYSMTRTGFHVPLTQVTLDQYVTSFSIPDEIDLSEVTYLAIRGGSYLRVRFAGTAPNKYAPGDWRWLKNLEPDLADAELVYNVAQQRTYYTGFTGTFIYVYIDTWQPVKFYSEPSPHSLPYTIDAQNRRLYLSEWGVFRHTNPLELYGTSLIERSSQIVFIDSNGTMTSHIPYAPNIYYGNGVNNVPGVWQDVDPPIIDWYDYQLVYTIYNDQGYDINVYQDPSTSPDNVIADYFRRAPDAHHQYCFEYDPTTMVEDNYGRIVNFIPITEGYVGIGAHANWPYSQEQSVNGCRETQEMKGLSYVIDSSIHLVEV